MVQHNAKGRFSDLFPADGAFPAYKLTHASGVAVGFCPHRGGQAENYRSGPVRDLHPVPFSARHPGEGRRAAPLWRKINIFFSTAQHNFAYACLTCGGTGAERVIFL